MKTVKSRADLERMALAQGASVAVGSSVFNAAGETAKVVKMPMAGEKKAPEPTPAAKPAPAPNVEVHPVNQVHVDTQPMAAAHLQIAELMAAVIKGMPQPASPVREWVFTVARDADGYIKDITAKAK